MVEKKRNNQTKNLVRRPRLHPDWPITVYAWNCWPVRTIPQSLWDTARGMQDLWNELVDKFEKVRALDVQVISKEERKKIYSALNLRLLRAIAQRCSAAPTSVGDPSGLRPRVRRITQFQTGAKYGIGRDGKVNGSNSASKSSWQFRKRRPIHGRKRRKRPLPGYHR